MAQDKWIVFDRLFDYMLKEQKKINLAQLAAGGVASELPPLYLPQWYNQTALDHKMGVLSFAQLK